jgi:hypothetical protein
VIRLKLKTKLKVWARLGQWQYDMGYIASKLRRLIGRFIMRHLETGAIILSILVFLTISWWMLIITALKVLELAEDN